MVYIVRMGDSPYIKIGHTKHDDIAKRIAELQTGCPEEISVHRLIINGDNALERKLHNRFVDARTSGGTEWFKLSIDDLEWLSTSDIESLINELDLILARRREEEKQEKHLKRPAKRGRKLISQEELERTFLERFGITVTNWNKYMDDGDASHLDGWHSSSVQRQRQRKQPATANGGEG